MYVVQHVVHSGCIVLMPLCDVVYYFMYCQIIRVHISTDVVSVSTTQVSRPSRGVLTSRLRQNAQHLGLVLELCVSSRLIRSWVLDHLVLLRRFNNNNNNNNNKTTYKAP